MIDIGDMVIILRDCCGETRVGHVMQVEEIMNLGTHCPLCFKTYPGPISVWSEGDKGKWARPLSWLKKLPPVEENTDVYSEMEVIV